MGIRFRFAEPTPSGKQLEDFVEKLMSEKLGGPRRREAARRKP